MMSRRISDSHGRSRPALEEVCDRIRSRCTDCGACRMQCSFLQRYGTPLDIVGRFDFSRPAHQRIAFECSLCTLCDAVCPAQVAPCDLFLALRRQAAGQANGQMWRYLPILAFEKWGTSPLLSYYGLPEGCDTVFFPGCALPGTRPETTWRLFTHLQHRIPTLGIVLDCCTKPSHDLGRQHHFEKMFAETARYLSARGIRKVLVACPSCHTVFKQYGTGLTVDTVYPFLSCSALPPGSSGTGELAIHDPCSARTETAIQDDVRSLLSRMGLPATEMPHHRERTLCCGEGGSVGFVQPDLAGSWSRLRRTEAQGRKLVTYCTGCADRLSRRTPTVHVADLLFFPEQALNGGMPVAQPPHTYANRWKLKQRFLRTLAPAVQGRIRPLA